MSKYLIYICVFFILANCSNKTIYSGKIISQDDLESINFENKENLISKLGYPSYIDPIQNKFFYFSEKSKKKSVFRKKIEYSYIFVFDLDDDEKIINTKVFDIKEIENINFTNDKTSNTLIKRGLLERIFGGVGIQQDLPTTP